MFLQIESRASSHLLPWFQAAISAATPNTLTSQHLVVIDRSVNLRSDLGVGGNNGSNAGPGQIEGLGGEVKITVRRGSTPST